MKTIKKLSIFMAFIVCLLPQLQAQETRISLEQLPNNAQSFLEKNFKGQNIDYILMDKELAAVEYKIRFQNGAKVEFDKKGEWKEIEGNPVSSSILPGTITNYLSIHYKDANIIKIEKEKGYEVKLSNGLELKFNSKGKFIRIDS